MAPVTSYAQGSAGGSYTVRGGDTLSGIAAQLWGDAGLWYKLAEANGLGGAAALVAGQSLTIPAGVQKSTHSAATFTPYDPAEAMGDTAPGVQPRAKKNKCGAFGAILLTVIAVAVTALTAVALPATAPILTGALSATAGSVVSQAVGVATGIQDKFDWKGVAMAGLTAAVTGGLSGYTGLGLARSGSAFLNNVVNGAVRGVVGSVIAQGIGVATRLQKDFSWLGVATAGVGGGVSGGLGGALKLQKLMESMTPGNIARTALTNTVAGIANAATRALATGTSFGDNVLAALPDVLGQTVGGVLAGGVSGSRATAAPASRATGIDLDASIGDDLANYEAPGVDLADGAADGLQQTINRQHYRTALVAQEHARNVAAASGSSTDPTPYDYEITVVGRRDARPPVLTITGEFASSAIVQREKAGYQASFDSKPGFYNVGAYKAAMANYDQWYAYLSGIEAKVDARIDREIGGIVLAGPVGGGLLAGAVLAAPTIGGFVYANAFRIGTAGNLAADFAAGTQASTYLPAAAGGVTASLAVAERAHIVTDLGLSSGRYSLGAPVLQGFEATPGTIRAFGPAKGWSVGDDIYALTKGGNDPAWSTVRSRFWKNEAANPQNGTWNAGQLDRMGQGLAPQRYNFDKRGIESMDLSHEPIPFRSGGRSVVPRWPQDHAAIDPYRHPGY